MGRISPAARTTDSRRLRIRPIPYRDASISDTLSIGDLDLARAADFQAALAGMPRRIEHRGAAWSGSRDGCSNGCSRSGPPPNGASRISLLPKPDEFSDLGPTRTLKSGNVGLTKKEIYSETPLVSYCCGLFADGSNRQCKRLSPRCGVGWRRWTYGPPYIPRYFWRVRGRAVRPSFVHQMEKNASGWFYE
jgi:hypothetical protein